MTHLELNKVNIEFSDFKVEDISLKLDKGKLLVLLGPSGSGKSSLIQAISGIIPISKGQVLVNGEIINDLPVHKRKIGIVFQDFALFPHLNVYENIAFGMRIKGTTKSQIKKRVSELLDLIELTDYEKRMVFQLSGGEKQRVALARTLAAEPEIILFDEPMSALDENLRDRLRTTIKRILDYLNLTCIYVTHDQNEAFFLADYIGIMHEGKLISLDTADNIYKNPNSLKTAEFLGIQNILDGVITEKQNNTYSVKVNNLVFFVKSPLDFNLHEKVKLLIKSESGILSHSGADFNSFDTCIHDYKINGSIVEFVLKFEGFNLAHKSFRTLNLDDCKNKKLYYNLHSEGMSLVKT